MTGPRAGFLVLLVRTATCDPVRTAHRVVPAGLARYGPERQLWAFLPASYVAKGDLEAATRAREAIVVSGKGLAEDERRLAEPLEAMS